MSIAALKKLHTAMLDTREGYEVAEKDAKTPALKIFFEHMIILRTRDHEALHQALTGMGEHPDDSGSFMATVHKAVTSVRAAVTGIDNNALSPFISGEEKLLEEYDAAIEEAPSNNATRDMLVSQKAALLKKISEMKAMKPA